MSHCWKPSHPQKDPDEERHRAFDLTGWTPQQQSGKFVSSSTKMSARGSRTWCRWTPARPVDYSCGCVFTPARPVVPFGPSERFGHDEDGPRGFAASPITLLCQRLEAGDDRGRPVVHPTPPLLREISRSDPGEPHPDKGGCRCLRLLTPLLAQGPLPEGSCISRSIIVDVLRCRSRRCESNAVSFTGEDDPREGCAAPMCRRVRVRTVLTFLR